jgi:hypothetical protein
MSTLKTSTDALRDLAGTLAGTLAGLLADDDVRALGDEDLLVDAAVTEQLGRLVDGRRVAVAGEVADRSRRELGTEGLAASRGCRNANELLQRVTLVAARTEQRCFTPQQRWAIMARDGGCIIPGCSIPAGWTEIHHVKPDRGDGQTRTDNGVGLCWWHRHMLEMSGWQIRMHHGRPQVRAAGWLDRH